MVLWQETGLASQFKLVTLVNSSEKLLLELVSIATDVRCPLCHGLATRVHSKYTRTLRDLPCLGKPLQLLLHLRKFFCDWPHCRRKIFTERLDTLTTPWAKLTNRLVETITNIGLATCGRLGSRLAGKMGIPISPHIILRRIKQLPSLAASKVKLLGIDDFSYKRGRRFGTILVDLAQHRVIDILADREVETVVAWLKMHPEIEVVSRDRGADYAQVARLGAPQAVQVADRFHVMKNLTEVVEAVLTRQWSQIKRELKVPAATSQLQVPQGHQPHQLVKVEAPLLELTKPTTNTTNRIEALQQQRYQQRLENYEQLVKLREQGFSYEQIAQQLGISYRTVARWIAQGPPKRTRRPKHSRLEKYGEYLRQRLAEGCRNAKQLYREIKELGYTHSYVSMSHYLKRLEKQATALEKSSREAKKLAAPVITGEKENVSAVSISEEIVTAASRELATTGTNQPPQLTVKGAIWLFVKGKDALEVEERTDLQHLMEISSELERLYELVQAFREMLYQIRISNVHLSF